jgi:hypothetical protein
VGTGTGYPGDKTRKNSGKNRHGQRAKSVRHLGEWWELGLITLGIRKNSGKNRHGQGGQSMKKRHLRDWWELGLIALGIRQEKNIHLETGVRQGGLATLGHGQKNERWMMDCNEGCCGDA